MDSAKKFAGTHKGKDGCSRSRKKDGDCNHSSRRKESNLSPSRTTHPSFELPPAVSDSSRKPSRSSGLQDPEEYRGIPPQPAALAPAKLPSKSHDRRRDWSDSSPVLREHSDPHLCRDFQTNTHPLSSRRGGAESPPARHATIPRERSPSRRQRSKHSTMPRGSSPLSPRPRPASSALTMPCSPPPYVDPKDNDCGCSCDCKSSYFPSQEVRTVLFTVTPLLHNICC